MAIVMRVAGTTRRINEASVRVFVLRLPFPHPWRDSGAHDLFIDEGFNVGSELGEIFGAVGDWVALQCSINNGLRKIGIEGSARALNDQNILPALGTVMLTIGVP